MRNWQRNELHSSLCHYCSSLQTGAREDNRYDGVVFGCGSVDRPLLWCDPLQSGRLPSSILCYRYSFIPYIYLFLTHPIAVLYLALYPLIAYSLLRIAEMEKTLSPASLRAPFSTLDSPNSNQIRLSKLFHIPRFTFGLFSQVVVYCAVTFLQPTLALHL